MINSDLFHYIWFVRKKQIFLLLIFVLVSSVVSLNAQDSSHTKSIKIISSYKPVLKPVTKLSFSASPLPPPPARSFMTYNLPDQQYKVMMKPVDLKPAAFVPDSVVFTNHHYVKIGYGNFQRIYADAGSAWGAGKPVQVQVAAGHHALRGNLPFQQNNRTYASVYTQIFMDKQVIKARAFVNRQNIFYYGSDPASLNAKKDSIRQRFDELGFQIDWSNSQSDESGIFYNPSLQINRFSDRTSYELNALIRLPVSVSIGSRSKFSLLMDADLTRYDPFGAPGYNNHIAGIHPSFSFPVKDLTFDAGGRFAWDQGTLHFLPQFALEAFLRTKAVILQAGWQSAIQKNNFRELAEQNPWIRQPLSQFNTRRDDVFLGMRGDLPFRLNYRIRGGVTNFHQLPLFINTKQPSVFDMVSESSLKTISLRGMVEWLPSEKLTVHTDFELFQPFQQADAEQAWHFIPLKVNASAEWKPVKKLIMTCQVFGWDGPNVLTNTSGTVAKLPVVIDVNISADMRIHKAFSLWLELNNLFNQAYQRWYQYPVVGLQVVGGIRLNFEQIK